MVLLRLDAFLEVVQEFERDAIMESSFWSASDRLGNFLAQPISQDSGQIIDKFLRDFRSLRGGPVNWPQLERLWTPEMTLIANALAGDLLTANFDSAFTIGNHELSTSEGVEILYSRLKMVEGIGTTNASKILSVSKPGFFVMWDKQVRTTVARPHGVGSGPDGYCRFLLEMQRYAQQLVNQVMTKERLSLKEAVEWLECRPLEPSWKAGVPRRKPVAKLVDECNYWLLKSNFFRGLSN